MAKSKYNDQAIQELHDDHVATGRRYGSMTLSEWQTDGCDMDSEPCTNTSFSQRNFLSQARSRRIDMPTPRRRQHQIFSTLGYLLVIISLWIVPASAAFIEFDNCLSESVQKDTPKQLQFTPYFVNAVFNTTDPSHTLQITVWGNVSGSGPTTKVVLPAWNNTEYWNSNQTAQGGKIVDIPDPTLTNPKLTTLFNKVDVLTYEPYSNAVDFCQQLGKNFSCPLSPVFSGNL